MAGFALSTDEIASVCRNLAAQMGAVPDRIEEVRSSEVAPADFGGGRYVGLVSRYIDATQEVIPRLLDQYAVAGRAMAQRIEDTLASYVEVEGDAADSLGGKAP